MWEVESEFRVILGGNTYINTPKLITYKGESLFLLKRRDSDGRLGIDFDIFGEQGERVSTVRNGNVVQGNEKDYDIRRDANHYVVRHKASGRIICDIKRSTAAAEIELAVDMFSPSGFHLIATPTQTNIGTHVVTGCVFKNCGGGIAVG